MGIRAEPLRASARQGALAITGDACQGLPDQPYCGIRPFGYAEHKIFFARAAETRHLRRLVAISRGVLLYGDSGTGKSSLVNAGLLPSLGEDGTACERLRLQPRMGEEVVLERIEDAGTNVESSLVGHDASASELAFSIASFERRVRAACAHRELLLVFDHFENVIVLFDGIELEDARRRLIKVLVDLLRDDTLKVKLLLVFREDYLGWITELLATCPDRFLSHLRLQAPGAYALERIIRGPFEQYPGRYDPEFAPSLVQRLLGLLAERFGAGEVSLSEVQTVCLRLWQSEEPQMLLESRKPQGILEDYLSEELDEMTPQMREAAIVLLSEMVTPARTRNIISGEDLERRVSENNDISPTLIRETLEQLDQRSRLVHCERRRNLRLYEIASESLVPWISERSEQLERQRERSREQRRRSLLRRMATGAMLVSAILVALTAWALVQRGTARRAEIASRREAVAATSLALLSASQQEPADRPETSLLLALDAYEMNASGQARSILISALEEVDSDGVLGILHGATADVSSLAFGRNDQVLVAGTGDGTARLWNVSKRKQITVITAGSEAVKTVIFAPNGSSFATADEDGTIRLWDARTYQQLGGPIETHDRVLEDVAFSPNGKMLAAGGLDGPLSMWSVATHKELGDPIIATKVFSVAFSPNGQILATGDNQRAVRLWSVRTHRQLGGPLTTLTNEVTEVAFSPDGRTLATLTTELFGSGKIQLWNIASHRQLGTAIGGNKEIASFAFVGNGRTLAAGGNGGTTLWDVASDKEIGQPLRGANHVATVAFSPDDGILASSEGDLVELAPVAPVRSLEAVGHAGARLLGFASDGRSLMSVSASGQVRHWSPISHAQLGPTLDAWPVTASCRVLSPDGNTLASEDRAGTIWLWDLVSGHLLATITTGLALEGEPSEAEYAGCAQRLSLSPNGRLLAAITGEAGKEVQLWNVLTRSPVGRLVDHGEAFRKIVFSPDGGTLVSGTMRSTSSERRSRIQLWNVESRRRLVQGIAVAGEVGQIVSGPDGRPVALVHITNESAEVGGVLLWEASARKQLGWLSLAQGESVANITLSPNGQTLATVSGEAGGQEEAGGAVRLWDPATREPVGSPLTEAPESVRTVAFNPSGTALALSVEGGIRLWRGILWTDLRELHAKVCGLVGEGLTRTEWSDVVPGIPYNPVC